MFFSFLNRVLESFETIVYGCAIVFRIENRVCLNKQCGGVEKFGSVDLTTFVYSCFCLVTNLFLNE